MNVNIVLPHKLDVNNGISFVEKLYLLPEADEYIFDFMPMDWVEPFALLYVSHHIAVFRGRRLSSKFTAHNFSIKNAHLYAAHMGFFRSFGLDYGKGPGEARGSSYYIPIEIFDIVKFQQEAYDEGIEVGDVLERHSRRLACVLTRETDGALVDTLEYALREMFRNVAEHSGANQIGFCAQYWPTKNRVELAILDNGMGLWQSLKPNPFLDIKTDKDAINYSLLPGVSGKAYKGAPKQRAGFWSNSGFGLYMTSELCRNGGDFLVCSGLSGVFLRDTHKINLKVNHKGTAIRLALNTDKIESIKNRIEEYQIKGQNIASKLKGAIIEPSYASTMLARDFK